MNLESIPIVEIIREKKKEEKKKSSIIVIFFSNRKKKKKSGKSRGFKAKRKKKGWIVGLQRGVYANLRIFRDPRTTVSGLNNSSGCPALIKKNQLLEPRFSSKAWKMSTHWLIKEHVARSELLKIDFQ